MNSRERVRAALRRQPADRVPIFMWFHPDTARRLAGILEIPASHVAEAMGDDVRMTWVNNNAAMEGIVHERDGESHTDAWGIGWVRQHGFNQIEHFPLLAAGAAQLRDYRFPTHREEELLGRMAPVVAAAGEYFIGCDVSPCVFEMYWRLRGMEAAMLDIATAPELASEMLDRCADFAVRLSEAACDRFPLDWLWTGDDVAGQQGMMVSPRTWRRMMAPGLKRVFDVGKARGLWVAYHCCGALRPIIPDLIAMGMDVLNPVQGNCPGMDPLELKREFGSAITFMGGVDTQELLPHGSVGEVRRATGRLLEGMTADGGGYILAASHTIPPETPDENIFAMYEVAGLSRAEIFDRAATIRQRLTGAATGLIREG
jgi:uroporphyrinogen decarboxylase